MPLAARISSALARASSMEWAGTMCRSETMSSGASETNTTVARISRRAKIWLCHWSMMVSVGGVAMKVSIMRCRFFSSRKVS